MKRRRSDKINRAARRQAKASKHALRAHVELLIDGYNLMHVTRFKPLGNTDGELKRCRDGLLSCLAEMLPIRRYRKITVVFDSNNAPRSLPQEIHWRHLRVLFARDHNSADELIATLVQQHGSPSQLVIVSSDHQVQVTAQRRKAGMIDSDTWFDAIVKRAESTHGESDSAQHADSESDRAERPTDVMSNQESAEFLAAMHEPIERAHDSRIPSDSRPSPGKNPPMPGNAPTPASAPKPPQRSKPLLEKDPTDEPYASPFSKDYLASIKEEFPDELI